MTRTEAGTTRNPNPEAVRRITAHLWGEDIVNLRAAVESFANGWTVVDKPVARAPVLLVTLARQYHGLAGFVVVGERGDHRDGSWINCPNHFCRMAQPYAAAEPERPTASEEERA
jgi:hypothetical protein